MSRFVTSYLHTNIYREFEGFCFEFRGVEYGFFRTLESCRREIDRLEALTRLAA